MGEANIWQPRSVFEVDANSKSVPEKFTAIEGQNLFNLTLFTYVVATGSLQIHKNGLLLTKGTDWEEQTSTTFTIVKPCTAGDIVLAIGNVGNTGNVDVRDTDIFVTNYQAIRDYAGTEITLYAQGQATHADEGESFFGKVTGAAPGFYVDNNLDILVPTGGDGSAAWLRGTKDLDNRLDRLNPASLNIAVADARLEVEDVIQVGGDKGAKWDVVLKATVTVDGVDIRASTANLLLAIVKRIANRNGGAFLIYDDNTAATKNDLIPISVSEGFKTGLAMFHSGMASSYLGVTLNDALGFRKNVSGELLSHSMNSVVLDNSLDLTYGESLIRTAATEFSQFGFEPRGFVAPNSVLDVKFLPQLKQSHDYAFVRSVGAGAGTAGVNVFGEDKYNLVRVALESVSLDQAKGYVDTARAIEAFVCFYTHTDVGYLPALMTYITDTYRNINPSEWIGDLYGLGRDISTKHTGNLLENSEFSLIRLGDTTPHGWSFVAGTLTAPTLTITDNEGGAIIDLDVATSVAGDSGTFSQNYFFTQLSELTAFVSSVYARSLAISNTQVKMAIYAKNSVNTTISSVSKIFDIAANRQKIEIPQAFIPDATVDHILVEMTFTAIGSGGVRCLFDSPQLERAGFPTAYESTRNSRYYSVLRRAVAQNINANTDTTIIFESSLEGTNSIFDLVTGEAKPNDLRNYNLVVNVGINGTTNGGLAAGDLLQLFLIIDGNPTRQTYHTATAGQNLISASFDIRGDGRVYKIGMRHNGVDTKGVTTFGDATMTVTAAKG